jgi:hypothetical protein
LEELSHSLSEHRRSGDQPTLLYLCSEFGLVFLGPPPPQEQGRATTFYIFGFYVFEIFMGFMGFYVLVSA